MRAALVIPETVLDTNENKRRILAACSQALPSRPDLILLPETATSGSIAPTSVICYLLAE